MARWNSRSAVVTLEDNAGTSITCAPTPGDLSIGPIAEGNVRVEVVKNRGSNDDFVEVEDLVQDWTITINVQKQSLTSASAARILDFIRKANYLVSLQSVSSYVWAHKVVWNGGSGSAKITLPKARVDGVDFKEGETESTLTITGRNIAAPTFV